MDALIPVPIMANVFHITQPSITSLNIILTVLVYFGNVNVIMAGMDMIVPHRRKLTVTMKLTTIMVIFFDSNDFLLIEISL